MQLGRGYFRALGRKLIGDLGYDYDQIRMCLGIRDEAEDCPDFLKTAVLNHTYGETRDFVYQLQYFQKLIGEHAAADARIQLLANSPVVKTRATSAEAGVRIRNTA
jgi:hypothetical protein